MLSRNPALSPCLAIFVCLGACAIASAQQTPALLALPNLEEAKTDTRLERLYKECFNTTKREVAAKMNLWQQELLGVELVIEAVERLHELRVQTTSDPIALKLAYEKSKAASHLLKACRDAKPRNAAMRETELITLEAYCLRCKIEVEKIRLAEKEAEPTP